ncbi:MAG: tRNA (adenosine(37)-N6)-threonylcarbamoyltransferase complex dimerization subunit type 1 TsaB [Thermomicrobiales bacterium]|nr:MAG: tRNA (adenosine(37)-N6)-threonylcarbamoyltransferase complex dimerization subunit type 1 TsaB [Thermomicrobiales bacterium]
MLTKSSSRRQSWLLAIDTSSEQAGIALLHATRTAETVWFAGRDQTTTVLSEIDCLRRLVGIDLSDLAAVAVATGPGMFNSLRVGMSVAKGFVLGLDLPLIGIPTLDIAAYPYSRNPGHVIATVAAGRGRLVWAIYGGAPVAWRLLEPPHNGTLDELIAAALAIGLPLTITGELTGEQERAIRATTQATVPPPSARMRQPLALAELAWQRLEAGDVDDPVSLEPVYLHPVPRPAHVR